MLKLQQITKTYDVGGDLKVQALRGIDLEFRKSEFVSILGPSGCGKTTLLNIIGGLDRNTTGDLFISGKSTAHYGDREWDNYRNHSIGFVFQSYNLIPHMDVLANVELAPTISGVSKAERRIRSVEALKKVGLGDQLHKKPNQLSGGQMQRVAIARALVNDPEILLADEPTGALDTVTSVQIMELLKEISKDRLIIMVTHNPDLAEEYSSRIIKLKDGLVVDDSDPYVAPVAAKEEASPAVQPVKKKKKKEKMASMSFFTALSLSTKNLLTKKARTALVSFAGSIGIIGIALILSLSNGVQIFIDQVQEDTLSAYPLSINKYSSDTAALYEAMVKVENNTTEFEEDRIYPDDSLGSMMSAMTQIKTNNIEGFIDYFEEHKGELKGSLNAYKLIYDLTIPVYTVFESEGKESVIQTNPTSIFDYMGEEIKTMMSSMTALAGGNTGMTFYQEMLEGVDGELINPVVKEQYDLVGENSRWPENANEVVLVVGENNRISNMALYALGFKDPNEIEEVLGSLMDPNKEYDNKIEEGFYYELDDFIGHTFTYVLPTDYFYNDEDSGHYTVNGKKYPIWNDRREQIDFKESDFLEQYGKDLTVVGIIRPDPDATSTSISSPIAYTAALTRDIIAQVEKTDLAIQQKATPDYDVFSGTTFEEMEFTKENIDVFLDMLKTDQKQSLIMMINQMMQTAFTEERLPATLQALDDQSFATMVKMYAPNYTKANVGEFVASLDEQSAMALIGMLTQQTGQPITTESLPAVLSMMDDESFNGIVAMFDKSAPKYSKDQIDAFLEAIGEAGRGAMLEQFKKNIVVTEENLAQTLSGVTDEEYEQLTAYYLPEDQRTTYETNLTKIGYQDKSRVNSIQLFAVDFNGKDEIKAFVNKYNEYAVNKAMEEDPGKDEKEYDKYKVEISDMIGALMSGINVIINAISYVLIAFVAISLVVSSIMIAIITYISVLERIKEIGILRSLGASKKNVRQVFNAETLIEGFISGALGIIVTLIVCLIANPIIHELTNLNNINATLPVLAVPILIGISVLLNVIAGLVPAYLASKKDPVIALRSE